MNLPNRLSLVRMGLIPVLVVLLALRTPVADYVALAVFAFAAFTDFLDGYIARKRKIITAFGTFMDPVADKLLVLSALVMLVDRGLLAGWFPVAVLARELLVDGLRLVAVTRGQVIPAGKLGKILPGENESRRRPFRCDRRIPGGQGLRGIRRTENMEVWHGSQHSQLLYRFMGGPVLSYADGIMGQHIDGRQLHQSR